MPEFRQNPITGRWVIVASERAKRPGDFKPEPAQPEKPGEPDPFAEGAEQLTSGELFAFRRKGTKKDGPGWYVRVVPNRFPILTPDEPFNERKEDGPLFRKQSGFGRHEVVISVWHNTPIVLMNEKQSDMVVQALMQRHYTHRHDPHIKYALIFLNFGKGGGASISHPHNQILAMPSVTKEIASEVAGSKRYADRTGHCIYCDIIAEERRRKIRVVYENREFLVFSPFYARFPFELRIVPKKHQTYFDEMNKAQRLGFGDALKAAWGKTWNTLGDPPINYIIHTAPVDHGTYKHYHWHVAFFPRLSIPAGVEIGSGAYVNSTPPEIAAEYLRKAPRVPRKKK